MRFSVPRGLGIAFGNLIRQTVLSSVVGIRPIGFKFSDDYFNSDSLIDVHLVVNALHRLEIDIDESVPLPYRFSVKKNGSILASDLDKSPLRVKTPGNTMIAEVLGDKSVSMEIVFDKVVGQRNSDQNRTIMLSNAMNDFCAISINAGEVNCNYTVTNDVSSDYVTVTCTDDELLRSALGTLSGILSNMP